MNSCANMEVLHMFVCLVFCMSIVASSNPVATRTHHANSKCSPTTFTFSLSTFRNRTGKWTSQAELKHGSDDTTLPWNVHIDHTSVQCNDEENIAVTATVSGDCYTGEFDITVSSFCTNTVKPGPGYELIRELGFYKLYTAAQDWVEARKTCVQDGAHLLILNSGTEMDEIKKLWSKNSHFTNTDWQNYIHIGVHDLYKEGEYVTILDQPLSQAGYAVWDKNEPNDAGGTEDCMSLKDTGGLNDVRCDLKLAFICEREL